MSDSPSFWPKTIYVCERHGVSSWECSRCSEKIEVQVIPAKPDWKDIARKLHRELKQLTEYVGQTTADEDAALSAFERAAGEGERG